MGPTKAEPQNNPMLGAFCGLAADPSGAQPTVPRCFDEEMWEIEVPGVFVRAIATGHLQRKPAWQTLEFERDIQTGDLEDLKRPVVP